MNEENEKPVEIIDRNKSTALLSDQIEKEINSCQKQVISIGNMTNFDQKQLQDETKQMRQMNNFKLVKQRENRKISIESIEQIKDNTSHSHKTPVKKQFQSTLWKFSTPNQSYEKEEIKNNYYRPNEGSYTNHSFSNEKQNEINPLPSLQAIIQEFLRFRSDYRATRLINYEKFEQLESYRRLLREGMLSCPSNELSRWDSQVRAKTNNKENTQLQQFNQSNQADKLQYQSWQYYPSQLSSLQCMENLLDSPADVIISKSSYSKLRRYTLFLSHFLEDTQLMRQQLTYLQAILENIEIGLLETQKRIKNSHLQLQETFFRDNQKRDYLERLQKQLFILESLERSTDNVSTKYQSHRINTITQEQYQQGTKDLNNIHSITSHQNNYQKQNCLELSYNNTSNIEYDNSNFKSSHHSSCQISIKKQQKYMQQTLNNQQQNMQQQFVYTQFNSPECPSSNKGSFSLQKSADIKTTPLRKKPAIGSFIRLAASENGTMDFYNLYGGSYKPSPSPFVSDFK